MYICVCAKYVFKLYLSICRSIYPSIYIDYEFHELPWTQHEPLCYKMRVTMNPRQGCTKQLAPPPIPFLYWTQRPAFCSRNSDGYFCIFSRYEDVKIFRPGKRKIYLYLSQPVHFGIDPAPLLSFEHGTKLAVLDDDDSPAAVESYNGVWEATRDKRSTAKHYDRRVEDPNIVPTAEKLLFFGDQSSHLRCW